MSVGAAVFHADWLALDSMWAVPTRLLFLIAVNFLRFGVEIAL
jgi:hypothetical protein